MKKSVIIAILIMMILTSCGGSNNISAAPGPVDKPPETTPAGKDKEASAVPSPSGLKALTQNYDNSLNELIEGFNADFIEVDGARISMDNFRTDFSVVKRTDNMLNELENNGIDYYLSIQSGPGISRDGTVLTLFRKRTQAMYFSQMVREMISKYRGNKHLKGIHLDIGSPDVPVEDYYNTLSYIVDKVRPELGDLKLIVNFHPLTFENEDFKPEDLTLSKVTFNLNLYFTAISYPGYVQGFKTSYELNKNALLKRLEDYKEFSEKEENSFMITIKAPWIEDTDIMLQDMFEIVKMLNYDYRICSGNSGDLYDIRKNEDVLKVLKRHSQ